MKEGTVLFVVSFICCCICFEQYNSSLESSLGEYDSFVESSFEEYDSFVVEEQRPNNNYVVDTYIKEPSAMIINKIILKKYPKRENGEVWDNQGDEQPDPYFLLWEGNNLKDRFTSQPIKGVKGKQLVYDIGIHIESLYQTWNVLLLDKDTTDNEFMASGAFVPMNFSKSFPSIFTLKDEHPNGTFEIELDVTWIF